MIYTKDIRNDIELETCNCDLCASSDYFVWSRSRGNTLTKCRQCGLVWTNPRIKSRAVKDTELYAAEYFVHKKRMTNRLQDARRRVYAQERQQIERFIQGGTILDVGCGTGAFLTEFGNQWAKCGCDISQYAIGQAEQHSIQTFLGEFETIDFGDRTFDVIYMRASLHHTYSPQQTLHRAYELLRPGGVLAVCMSNNCSGLMGKMFKGHIKSYDQPVNYLFSKDTLIQYFYKNNFIVLDFYYPYRGTGYDSWFDIIEACVKYPIYVFLRLTGQEGNAYIRDFASPAFYGNYINIYARKGEHR